MERRRWRSYPVERTRTNLVILFISDINDYIPEEAELEKFAEDILRYPLDNLSPPKLQLDGNEIETASSYKYLGIEINNKLD
ncbi:unnamed protein product [Brachionus calyciflorus]|uniref:Uncharacterized protein n=1 Tax=Brachionus calyciflorus TaxID=104777 RepID=A0A814IK53_9BILA|nr:unnamed protein product [Brachionus calyciflorus]